MDRRNGQTCLQGFCRILIRYADDGVVCCEYEADALRIRQSPGKRLEKLKLHLNEDKTKLKRVNEWAKQIRHEKPMKEIWKIFKTKLRGYVQYYGVSHNIEKVNTILYWATKIMFKWLNRRSQRKSFTWEKFRLFMRADPLPYQ